VVEISKTKPIVNIFLFSLSSAFLFNEFLHARSGGLPRKLLFFLSWTFEGLEESPWGWGVFNRISSRINSKEENVPLPSVHLEMEMENVLTSEGFWWHWGLGLLWREGGRDKGEMRERGNI
jgi:hypothetical protein